MTKQALKQATIWVDVESLKEWEEIKRRRPKGKEAMLEEWRGRFTKGFGDFELSGKRLQEKMKFAIPRPKPALRPPKPSPPASAPPVPQPNPADRDGEAADGSDSAGEPAGEPSGDEPELQPDMPDARRAANAMRAAVSLHRQTPRLATSMRPSERAGTV
eukprot:CAMPEP_0181257712 /NCGR_PEP_ID=MMETSP1096-20121128/50393_1 /TAXON_ID=156174 ORGANISM="Chrysochromulina ericina, Strain CCMP281" /NCGR_SAMPLE_ID=MMETSP1096 /ASSEMBLY_ACC=CAM_ASM_000453 /LENGTH=159 /DNA_ID=CAMNT_0023356053 /DNA_START=22 /DNA_END=501 /DNA_ORIENTATION=+